MKDEIRESGKSNLLSERLREFYVDTRFANILYRGVSLREFISAWYFHFFEQPKSSTSSAFQSGICRLLGYLLRKIDITLGSNEIVFNELASERNSFRYVCVSVYPPEHRAFPILDKLISRFSCDEVLILTNNARVAATYGTRNYAVAVIQTSRYYSSKFVFKSVFPKTFWELRALFTISKARNHLDMAFDFLDKIEARLILTCCDLHSIERAFTEAAVARDIDTVTHQHGQIAPTNPQWKFVSSKYMVCWGPETRKHLETILERTQIKDFGTDLYGKLAEDRESRSGEQNAITLALNPRELSLNDEVISAFLQALPSPLDLPGINKLIIKLHPDMDLAFWEKRLCGLEEFRKIGVESEILTDQKNQVLAQSKILVTVSSSLVLEAYISGVSVIIINLGKRFLYSQLYLEGLPESFAAPELLGEEIRKRCVDDPYFERITRGQDKNLSAYVSSFNSSLEEQKWLSTLA